MNVSSLYRHTHYIINKYNELKNNSDNDIKTDIIDLITDLLHLADMEGLDPVGICRMAEIHISAETATNREVL